MIHPSFPFLGLTLNTTHLSYSVAFFFVWWSFRRELQRRSFLNGERFPCGRPTIPARFFPELTLLVGALFFIVSVKVGRGIEEVGLDLWWKQPLRWTLDAEGSNGFPGLMAFFLSVAILSRLSRYPVLSVLDSLAPGMAFAYAVGRIGCLVGGHCYGVPTSLPWGVKDPEGFFPYSRVHPTPAYEALVALCLALLLWRSRKTKRPSGILFGWFLWALGMERLLIELIRHDPKDLWGLSQAQYLAGIMVLVGMALVLRLSGRPPEPLSASS